MHNFLSFIKELRLPKKEEVRGVIAAFSRKELIIFIISSVVALISVIIILARVNNAFMVTIPTNGGSLTEGIVGMPTIVNPVLALSDADKDLTALVYSGLMRKMPDGTFIPDLAESYKVSADQINYTFIIKGNARFQDGTPVTADDVIFTIKKIQDPLIKSPRQMSWAGVTASKIDDRTVVFTLKQPYISFMDNMTIGILPEHLWKNVSVQEFGLSNLNIKAIGTGPYQIDSISKNSDGIPDEYHLKNFKNFALGAPHIKYINIISYANEKDLVKALLDHNIDQASGLSPENAESVKNAGYAIHTATLPRMFGMFFNSSKNKIFSDKAVIDAFDKALDRQEIVDQVLNGYGTIIYNPIPETIINDKTDNKYDSQAQDEAQNILEKGGWTLGADGIRVKGGAVAKTNKAGKKTAAETATAPLKGSGVRLSFSLTTGDSPELKHTAELIKEQLGKIGAEVDIKIYETGPLNQLIRERDYEALFFGQIVNHESDLFSFWHGTQTQDPGLNIAMYSDKKADGILEKIQKTPDYQKRISEYMDLINEFNINKPALMIYSPKYLYATSSNLNHVSSDTLTIPSDRFVSVYTWYASTDHVWKIFAK
ncbi:MAG TPA: peptide ABC transporter substrate-binding protein [Candidatus Paceibacterota bacterium]|nr:peptide ABC transporter substrate-binding protein [Candidatus Paceibacterota bacterium]